MVFTSITFLFYFLPATLLLYYAVPNWRDVALLLASLIFYAWGEQLYVLLLLGSITFNFLVGRELAARAGKERKTWLGVGVAVNLGVLGYFKYFAMLWNGIRGLGHGIGFDLAAVDAVTLPLGISFFTFQAISYLVDVYRGDAPVEKGFLKTAIYISMFPHLVAGPIVRFKTIVRDLHRRRLTVARFNLGIRHVVTGLTQKVLIANTLAPTVDAIFALREEHLTTTLAWVGMIGYTLQIYFDFAGYSNIAIGLAWMLGIRFPQNFNYPYAATSMTDFWRRWHMALSSWFRDYLYIPLGGNRAGKWATYRNLFVVFFLCGLWHGASMTFVVWGLYHGFFLVMERVLKNHWMVTGVGVLRRIYTLLAVMFGWVIFRCSTLEQGATYFTALFGTDGDAGAVHTVYQLAHREVLFAAVIGMIFSFPVIPRLEHVFFGSGPSQRGNVRMLVYAIAWVGSFVLVTALLAVTAYKPFIYFQF